LILIPAARRVNVQLCLKTTLKLSEPKRRSKRLICVAEMSCLMISTLTTTTITKTSTLKTKMSDAVMQLMKIMSTDVLSLEVFLGPQIKILSLSSSKVSKSRRRTLQLTFKEVKTQVSRLSSLLTKMRLKEPFQSLIKRLLDLDGSVSVLPRCAGVAKVATELIVCFF
jgi:hypothetical protein